MDVNNFVVVPQTLKPRLLADRTEWVFKTGFHLVVGRTVRIRVSCKTRRTQIVRQYLFVIFAYTPGDCSSDAKKDSLYQRLHGH